MISMTPRLTALAMFTITMITGTVITVPIMTTITTTRIILAD